MKEVITIRVRKDRLLRFVQERGAVTFEDLESYFEAQGYNFRGDAAIFTRHSKLALWTGWNRKTAKLFMELVAEGKLELFNPGMASAPAPPAFRGITGLSQADFLPVIIRAKKEGLHGRNP